MGLLRGPVLIAPVSGARYAAPWRAVVLHARKGHKRSHSRYEVLYEVSQALQDPVNSDAGCEKTLCVVNLMFGTPFSTQKLVIPAKKLSLGRFSLVMVACAKGHKRSHKSAGQETQASEAIQYGKHRTTSSIDALSLRESVPLTINRRHRV